MAAQDRLLERDAALAELDRHHRAAVRGDGRVVLLRGEAGVGKTAVIARFAAGLRAPTRVLRGWCDPLSAPRPLGPLIDMLAETSGERAAELRSAVDAGAPEAVYARLVAMFDTETAWVCVVEDAHWADGATLDLLRFLSRRVASLPLLLVVSYRDDEIGDEHPLAVWLGDLATSETVSRIKLLPLSEAAVATLTAGSGVNAHALHRLTGGNPFYVTEVLAAGTGAMHDVELPHSVSDAVRGRLARLSTAGRETAYAAAVCGPRANLTMLRQVCSAAADGLMECLHAGVLIADADTVGFRHELARRATLDQIPDFHRRTWHKHALAVLSREPIDQDMLGALTFHADQAGDSDAVVRYGPAAAARASSLGAHREAAELYALTLRRAGSASAEQKVTWLEQHASSSYVSGLHDAAAQSFGDAAALRRTMGDALAEGIDLRWQSHALLALGRTTAALRAGQASLRRLDEVGPSAELAWSLINLAEVAASTFDPVCSDYAKRAISLGTEFGDPAVVIRARCIDALSRVQRRDTGWDEVDGAWREAMANKGLTTYGGVTGAVLCWTAALHHAVERTEAYISETARYCDDHDLAGMCEPALGGAAALIALHRGDWVNALARADEMVTRPGLTALHRSFPLVTTALIRARRGDQPVGTLLDEALAAGEPTDLFRLGVVWAARAEAAWLAGDDDTARAEAQTGLAAATEQADPWLVGHLRRWAHLAGGITDDAPTVDVVTPYRLEVGGDWAGAVAEWTRLGCPYDAALAQLGGDIPAVDTALTTFRGLGARAAARRAQHRLAYLRGRDPDARHKSTIADPYGLTARERDVLDLLAAGHSDAEIATALFISPKTANKHVGAILAKLGVRNRTQAAAYAHREPPATQAN